MNNDFAEMIVDYIRNMKIGESNSIGAIVKNVFNKELNVDELFDIQDIVMQKCEEQGIICDYSKNEGAIVGLPFNINFIKKDKRLEEIKNKYFLNNEDYFYSICSYLTETFDSDILNNSIDECVRFELFDKANNKIAFFAINKNLFLLNYRYKHKMNLRGNSSEEIFSKLMNDLKSITQSWNIDYSDNGEYYWGLTLIQDNKCDLYVGKSISVDNWNEFITLINEIIKELLNNTINDTFI